LSRVYQLYFIWVILLGVEWSILKKKI